MLIKRKAKKVIKKIKKTLKNIVKTTLKKVKNKLLSIKSKDKELKIKQLQELNLEIIAKITGLKIPNELKKMAKVSISRVALASEQLEPNCLFFTLKKIDLDVEKAKKNALFVVTWEPIDGCNCIIVKNPEKYGKKYFNYLRNLYNPKVISVTGSVGKTSTKEMIDAVLNQKFDDTNKITSVGNSNSYKKVSNYVNKLTKDIKVYLQEVGAGSGFDIVRTSAEILEPDIAVYTNIKDSHIEWYGSRENIAKEKFTLSDCGKKNGVAIVNYDDPILKNHNFKQRKLSYSLNDKNADVYAGKIKITSEGTIFTINDNIRKTALDIKLSVIGEQHVINSLVAYIVAKEFKINNNMIKQGLSQYQTSGSRQNLINVGKYKILADCYNSSYDALSFILKTYNQIEINGVGKKYAVIGDIFELGDYAPRIHREVGKLLSKYNFEKVFFMGENSKYSYEEYIKEKNNSIYTENRDVIIKEINSAIKSDDIILFKASHGMHFAELIDNIFGTEIGEKSFINHKEYIEFTDKDMLFNLYPNHSSLKKYLGISKRIELPNEANKLNLEMLGAYAFYKNKELEELTLSNNITRIRKACFKYSFLKQINCNNNLKSIAEEAFSFCSNLEQIILPEGMLFIEPKAFANCKNLKKVYIPNSVMKISNTAFINSNNVVIYCHDKSYALKYAEKQKIKYELVD